MDDIDVQDRPRGRKPFATTSVAASLIAIAVLLAAACSNSGPGSGSSQSDSSAASSEQASAFRSAVLDKWSSYGPDLSSATDEQLAEIGSFVCSRPLQPLITDSGSGVALTPRDLPTLDGMIA